MQDLREGYHQAIKAFLEKELIEENPESAPLSGNNLTALESHRAPSPLTLSTKKQKQDGTKNLLPTGLMILSFSIYIIR